MKRGDFVFVSDNNPSVSSGSMRIYLYPGSGGGHYCVSSTYWTKITDRKFEVDKFRQGYDFEPVHWVHANPANLDGFTNIFDYMAEVADAQSIQLDKVYTLDPKELLQAYNEANDTIKLELEKRVARFTNETTVKDLLFFFDSPEVCSKWKTRISEVCPEISAVKKQPSVVRNSDLCKNINDAFELFSRAIGIGEHGLQIGYASAGTQDQGRCIAIRAPYKMKAILCESNTAGVQLLKFEKE